MKKVWITVSIMFISIIAVGGIVFIFGKSQPLTVYINNQNLNSVSGKIQFLDKHIEVSVIGSNTEQVQIVNISELRKNSDKQNETGKLIFTYYIGNTWNEVEIFGYIEPADNYLYGKKVRITIDKEGKSIVEFLN